MDKQKELPKRKELRIKQYDYSRAGAYFVTICVKDRRKILSDIVKPVGVDVSLRLGHARVLTTAQGCHSLRSRRFATSTTR